ncbi:hypothetical protein CERSUDRAFT_93785 [Gelatoporia subvermispora B]|uniref:Uncharacterized protein n=1 Tax=Ceriporiopsis subvermispora (strain B) TaxID=914234 RepID=M2PP59_CERS8|nr:hypothetical protein CERSUDRAFT_93785 [Gelatoporia subvermispora B]
MRRGEGEGAAGPVRLLFLGRPPPTRPQRERDESARRPSPGPAPPARAKRAPLPLRTSPRHVASRVLDIGCLAARGARGPDQTTRRTCADTITHLHQPAAPRRATATATASAAFPFPLSTRGTCAQMTAGAQARAARGRSDAGPRRRTRESTSTLLGRAHTRPRAGSPRVPGSCGWRHGSRRRAKLAGSARARQSRLRYATRGTHARVEINRTTPRWHFAGCGWRGSWATVKKPVCAARSLPAESIRTPRRCDQTLECVAPRDRMRFHLHFRPLVIVTIEASRLRRK